MKNFITALLLILTGAAVVFGQKPDEKQNAELEAKKAGMKQVEKLIGRWEGAGWIYMGKDRWEFTGTELVQSKLDGLALLVEGKYVTKTEPPRVMHETLAVLTYDPAKKHFDFRTNLATGASKDFVMTANEPVYEWGFDAPNGKILYIITIKDGVWSEIGKVSRDGGQTWFQFFEMNLKKQ